MIETHKHSGKETADISQILQERLGIKMGTYLGATESVSLEFGGFKQLGTSQSGYMKLEPKNNKYFGLTWTGGGDPAVDMNIEFWLPLFDSNPTAVSGSIYYNTTENKVKVNEDGTWKTITTS